DLITRGGLRQDGKQQARAARRGRPEDLGQASARQPSSGRIHLRNSRANSFRRGLGLPVKLASQKAFELLFQGLRAHVLFAFYSPVLHFYRNGVAVSIT